ncbi:MAG: 7-cyano-7-deazaguanine synthase QueC [Candidatus Firestonebacteria bacterium]
MKAIVLLSGGLDSTTTLYWAKYKGYKCSCLIFDYGQRHKREINSAIKIAKIAKCKYDIVKIKLPWSKSALTNKRINIPKRKSGVLSSEIPITYVSARNTIFLSFALSYAESIKASVVLIGANAIDYSGYPDCRPEYYKAYEKVYKLGTKCGIEGTKIKIVTPLINKTKSQIIKLALKLNVPIKWTWSCYTGEKIPCGKCDSCLLRMKGFKEVNILDEIN